MNTYNLINKSGMRVTFLSDGTLKSIDNNEIMINLFEGTVFDASVSNIYLRISQEDEIKYYPLISKDADFAVSEEENYCEYTGTAAGIKYKLRFILADNENRWFWQATVNNGKSDSSEVDFVYIQDIGIANKGAIQNNESYVCQYIDHTTYNDNEFGYLICSRQNQQQGNYQPWMMSGSFEKSSGFLTDGFQFFGLKSKEDGKPVALQQKEFANEKLQYEFACHILKSEWSVLHPGEKRTVTFFANFADNHPEITSESDIIKASESRQFFENYKSANFATITDWSSGKKDDKGVNIFTNSIKFKSLNLNEKDLEKYFGSERRNSEVNNSTLLSFFSSENTHIILKSKESITERPHGHILFSGNTLFPEDDTISSTMWMYGIFNSQVAIGNISFNKFITLSRSRLNQFQSQGQRIFIKRNGNYEILSMPSAFEIGLNHCRWIYKGEEETVIISTYVSIDTPHILLNIEIEEGLKREFLITTNMLNSTEIGSNFDVRHGKVSLFPTEHSMLSANYPDARLDIQVDKLETLTALGGDELLFMDNEKRDLPYIVIKTANIADFSLTLGGTILKQQSKTPSTQTSLTPEAMKKESHQFWKSLLQNVKMNSPENDSNAPIETLNEIIPWFAHNAMVHYTKPYGLEQYSGAAWGSRDICQGPVEFLLAFEKYEPVKKILLKIFKQQYFENGEWPQWFMFDKYYKIQHNECHGDIVVWPLKAVCDYIEASGDFSILQEEIPYSSSADFSFSTETASLSQHIDKLLDAVKGNFIQNTALICYGDGDWNDSLQPYKSEMRSKMVSVWTVALLYQTLTRYAVVCKKSGRTDLSSELSEICIKMKSDFNKFLIKDDITAGFAYFNDNGEIDLMLHPDDKSTGIKYRLLPAQRGIISEIFTQEQAEKHIKMIQNQLLFPDGVHLMDNAPGYNGGICKYFKRAETAAFFGREVGTFYVHAHLRYMEALAKLGRAEDLMQAFLAVNPINITENVKNAEIRQSNTYFSSSDPAVADRYEASAKFADLKRGKIKVKGGWRIYSSGPGIYLSLLITRLLGIRKHYDSLIIDPVLPVSCNNLCFETEISNKALLFTFNITKNNATPSKLIINGKEMSNIEKEENPYRTGGLKIDYQKFISELKNETNNINILIN